MPMTRWRRLGYHPDMLVTVVGATGNVGSQVLRHLSADPIVDQIVAVSRRPAGWSVPKVRWVGGDVTQDDPTPWLAGADALVQLAWAIQPSWDTQAQWNVNVVGTQRVLRAAAAQRVGSIVYLSSIGAYSPGPRDRAVDETWPTDGVPSLAYSWQKAYVERVLDRFEFERPATTVARLRPGLIFQRWAAREIAKYFLGPHFPGGVVTKRLTNLIARWAPVRFQVVHTTDVAAAVALALSAQARGPFNLAADEPLGADRFGLLGPLRAGTAGSWHLHLQPTAPGWIDLARSVPLMATDRARVELGWAPSRGARETLSDLLGGMHDDSGGPTPALR
jgi:UDP-glucose 4-epimerase